jgi:hypothetical protein
MSVDLPTRDSDDSNLREICEDIVADDGYSDRVQSMAETLLEGIKEGRIDVK